MMSFDVFLQNRGTGKWGNFEGRGRLFGTWFSLINAENARRIGTLFEGVFLEMG
jgi:hypothetical protein